MYSTVACPVAILRLIFCVQITEIAIKLVLTTFRVLLLKYAKLLYRFVPLIEFRTYSVNKINYFRPLDVQVLFQLRKYGLENYPFSSQKVNLIP